MSNIQPANINTNYSDCLRIVMIGKTGNGKSATSNSLLNKKKHFRSSVETGYVTRTCQAVTFDFNGKKTLLVDTPGLADLIRDENFILNELKNVMEYTYPGPHAFIIVLSAAIRFTNEEKYCIELLSKFFGKEICDHSLIVFSYIDNLEEEDKSLSEYISNNTVEPLRELINKCHNNYLGVSNRWRTDEDKMIKFRLDCFNMINKIIRDKRDGNEYYTSDQFKASVKFFEEEKERIKQEKISEHEKVEKLKKANQDLERRNEELKIAAQNAANHYERGSSGGWQVNLSFGTGGFDIGFGRR